MRACRCDPEQDERYQELEARVWAVHHPDEPMPGASVAGNEDDDIILEDGGAGRELSKNTRCPITMVEVRSGPQMGVARCGSVPSYALAGIGWCLWVLIWLAACPAGSRTATLSMYKVHPGLKVGSCSDRTICSHAGAGSEGAGGGRGRVCVREGGH